MCAVILSLTKCEHKLLFMTDCLAGMTVLIHLQYVLFMFFAASSLTSSSMSGSVTQSQDLGFVFNCLLIFIVVHINSDFATRALIIFIPCFNIFLCFDATTVCISLILSVCRRL